MSVNCSFSQEDLTNSLALTNLSNLTDLAEEKDIREDVYSIMLPLLVGFLVVSALTSATVLCGVPWLKRPISPIVRLSLSLSAANTAFSVTIATSVLIHSYLPFVHQIHFPVCVQLTVEVVRLSIILVQVGHLLAVALIHYCGAVRPLQYASTLSPQRMKWAISALWGGPHVGLFTAFSLIPGQAFQADGCRILYFYTDGLTFRVVWCGILLAGSVLLVAVYCRIFKLLSARAVQLVSATQRAQLQRNIKTVRTTALIVGTFILGWSPASMSFLLICSECPVPELKSKAAQMAIFSSNYIVFIIKVFADTFIYVLGLRDIRAAMFLLRCHVSRKLRTIFWPGRRSTDERSDEFRQTFRLHRFRSTTRTTNATLTASTRLNQYPGGKKGNLEERGKSEGDLRILDTSRTDNNYSVSSTLCKGQINQTESLQT